MDYIIKYKNHEDSESEIDYEGDSNTLEPQIPLLLLQMIRSMENMGNTGTALTDVHLEFQIGMERWCVRHKGYYDTLPF